MALPVHMELSRVESGDVTKERSRWVDAAEFVLIDTCACGKLLQQVEASRQARPTELLSAFTATIPRPPRRNGRVDVTTLIGQRTWTLNPRSRTNKHMTDTWQTHSITCHLHLAHHFEQNGQVVCLAGRWRINSTATTQSMTV